MILHNDYQKELVNRGSRSVSTCNGTPKGRTTCSKNIRATAGAVKVSPPNATGTNLQYLLYLSTHVSIPLNVLFPSYTGGRSVTKSMVHTRKGPSGMGSGCNKPAGSWFWSLLREHTPHPATKLFTVCGSWGHHTQDYNAATVFLTPRWAEYNVLCSSSRSSLRSPPPWGMTS